METAEHTIASTEEVGAVSMSPSTSLFGIVANVRDDKILRRGAKVLILHSDGDAERYVVRGLSLSGRRCDKRIPAKRLHHFRASWLREPDRASVSPHWRFADKSAAQRVAEKLAIIWEPVRSFREDGTTIKDGDTASGAFERARHVVMPNASLEARAETTNNGGSDNE